MRRRWWALGWLPILVCACVTNTSSVVHMTYKDGQPTEKITCRTTTIAFAGSKETLATGAVKLRIRGQWYTVGQSSQGLEAGGDPVALSQAIVPLIIKGAVGGWW